MLSLMVATLTLFQPEPAVKPAQALDPTSAPSVLEHALFNTRSQKSYETSYAAKLVTPLQAIDYQGRCVWVAPDVLYVHFRSSGNNEQKIVRAGEKHVWVHHAFHGQWFTADDFGDAGAGRGVQNPDEVLRVLAKHTAGATFLKSGALEATFTGHDLASILKAHGMKGVIDPQASSARVELTVDDKTRIRKLTCEATVVTAANEKIRYTTDLSISAYNGATEIVFTDEKKRPIPLDREMKDRIDAILNGKK